MPWCPKCKSEYREGFTVCADCGVELVDEEPVGKKTPADEFPEDFEIPEEFVIADRMSREALLAEAAEAAAAGKEIPDRSNYIPYQDSAERASENRSSGWVLSIIGGLGILAVILGVTGVIPFHMGNSYLFYGVMGAVFILFFVSGVMSIKNAKIFEKRAESENSLRGTLLDWCRGNLKAETIDSEVLVEGDGEEVMYFKRFSYIKEKLNRQFMNLDQGFLEKFIDDLVYEEVFEEKVNED